MDYIQTRELYHHGIKGQKWGIRRFQNEDGSLTPEGLRRYGTLENFEKSKDYRKILNKDSKRVEKALSRASRNIDRGDETSNLGSLNKRFKEDLKTTKEWKDYQESLKRHPIGPNGRRMYYDGATAEETVDNIINDMNIEDVYRQKRQSMASSAKYEQQFFSAVLKDIGENDTKVGRDYIKRMGFRFA